MHWVTNFKIAQENCRRKPEKNSKHDLPVPAVISLTFFRRISPKTYLSRWLKTKINNIYLLQQSKKR
jgi:hypothetical protein